MTRTFILIGALLGALGVGIGAFGAHGLEPTLIANGRLDTFETASRYHLIHAVALFAAAFVAQHFPGPLARWGGWLLLIGVLLFSGSLYLLAIFDLGVMGAVAPVGGAALIAGWALLGAAAWRQQP